MDLIDMTVLKQCCNYNGVLAISNLGKTYQFQITHFCRQFRDRDKARPVLSEMLFQHISIHVLRIENCEL